MRLIPASMVIDRLSLGEENQVVSALESAIEGATPHFESVLSTVFEAGTRTDIFRIDPAIDSISKGMYWLRCSRGFLRSQPKISIGESLEAVQSTAPAVLPSSILCQTEAGFVLVPSVDRPEPFWARVEYSFGFEDETDDKIPGWLKESVLSYSVRVVSVQQVADKKESLSKVYAFLETHQNSIVYPKLRSKSAAIHPLLS